MSDERTATKLLFTYAHKNSWGIAYISDGVHEVRLYADRRFSSPLLELIAAVARLRLYEESRCEWVN